MVWQVEWLILWKMIVKMLNTHTHGGVGIFVKEKKLELMWINSVKERRQGFETPLASYIEKIGSHRVDRTLVTW